jgi:hypothetical protein
MKVNSSVNNFARPKISSLDTCSPFQTWLQFNVNYPRKNRRKELLVYVFKCTDTLIELYSAVSDTLFRTLSRSLAVCFLFHYVMFEHPLPFPWAGPHRRRLACPWAGPHRPRVGSRLACPHVKPCVTSYAWHMHDKAKQGTASLIVHFFRRHPTQNKSN